MRASNVCHTWFLPAYENQALNDQSSGQEVLRKTADIKLFESLVPVLSNVAGCKHAASYAVIARLMSKCL